MKITEQSSSDRETVSYIKEAIRSGSIFLGKANRILNSNGVQLKKLNKEKAEAEFSVKSESSWSKRYKVVIKGYNSSSIYISCNCPYNWSNVCKHSVASLIFLRDEIEVGENAGTTKKDSEVNSAVGLQNNTIRIKELGFNELIDLLSWKKYNLASALYRNGHVKMEDREGNKAFYNVYYRQHNYKVTLEYDTDTCELKLSCNCNTTEQICIHKSSALLALSGTYGSQGLKYLKDWTEEKKRLLAEYGYSLSDNIDDKFKFGIGSGGIYLEAFDSSLHKLPGTTDFTKLSEKFLSSGSLTDESLPFLKDKLQPVEPVYVFFREEYAYSYPDTSFRVFAGKRKKNGEFYKNPTPYSDLKEKESLLTDEKDEEIIRLSLVLDRNVLLASFNSRHVDRPASHGDISKDTYHSLLRKDGEVLEKIFQAVAGKTVFLGVVEWRALSPDLINPFSVSEHRISISVEVDEKDGDIILSPVVLIAGEKKSVKDFEKFSSWIWVLGKKLYKMQSLDDIVIIEYFINKQNIKFRTTDFEPIFNSLLKPMAKKVAVNYLSRKIERVEGLKPAVNLYLREYDNFLLFTPRFEYAHGKIKEEAVLHSKNDIQMIDADTIFQLSRNMEVEKEYTDFFQSLHPSFSRNKEQEFYYLSADKLMERGWFFDVFDKLKEKNINVFGRNELTKIKYNTNRPNIRMQAGSGIDWFDMEVKVSFGDLEVSLMEIRKAIIARQSYVSLSDGSIGMLPEEWLEKYASLFRIGKIKDDTLRVSKLHFTIIDALEKEIDNEKVLQELQEKRQKLVKFSHIEKVAVPKNVKAQLRHYQQGGFHWLKFLHEFKWGGCLADDMGLGKTLQVLTLLQHLKNEKQLATSLIVVPTTLIFNWQEEVRKFCPGLSIHIHRGAERSESSDEFSKYDIVLTTYGTLRSDIKWIKDFSFDYVILDESQAIKNPSSQISRAVRLLNAQHRLAMTGTPVENNTFDLYSQLEFLNPGFLGSQEFFRGEYATPIDKNKDEKRAEQLRKLILPFMLKRRKEDVAKDLPEKTETVLYCEMGKKQRKVYDTFQKKYKQDILKMIEAEGLNKSGFLILEGLLKLRQICDSPALISADEDNYGEESVKLDELIREISENAGNHKILVFSQFLKMLDLVKQKLQEMNISYTYLDGQTVDRKQQVDSFQTDKEVRVFLISLKAGGFGINLTEADYVYLVDPWWNPAVEKQAIDRTHRIGQDKKVFAYKMICKNTVEEKILRLQEKKKFVADSLIDVDKNVMKKLTKEDIAELFS